MKNHTCINTASTYDGRPPVPCEACASDPPPPQWILDMETFERGRRFERWLREESDAFESSYGRVGFAYPESPLEEAEALGRFGKREALLADAYDRIEAEGRAAAPTDNTP
jgi:hypothetical protein